MENRRSSILNIETWLDECPPDEPDSVIYEENYCKETADIKIRQIEPEIARIYEISAKTCAEIGLPKNHIDSRLNDIDECILEFLKSIEKDITCELENLCNFKDQLLKQVQKMTRDLFLPEYVPEDNITLLLHCKRLKSKYKQLSVVKEERMRRLEELRDKQSRHCLILGIAKPPQLKLQTDIPTEDELKALATTVLELEKEEARRKAKYLTLKNDIKKFIDILEYKPDNEFETNVLTGKPDYTETNIQKMSSFYAKLESLHAKNQDKLNELTERLKCLYERLDTPQEARQMFFSTHSTCNPTLLLEMEDEVERYEELRKQNIGKFVEKIHTELIVEFNRCYCTKEEQNDFLTLITNTQDYTEELLGLCERELERLKKYYKDNKEILDKIHKWVSLFDELLDIELKPLTPSRLTNRGGQLLMEERKRKTLQKNLPKLEKEIHNLGEKFLEKTGSKFKVSGSDLDDFIANYWDQLNTGKEEQKKERLRAKMTTDNSRKPMALSQAAVKRTPAKRPAGAGITPTPTKLQCQRFGATTPTNSNIHRSQLGGLTGSSVKKSAQKSIYSSNNNLFTRARKLSDTKSSIPVPTSHNTINTGGSSAYGSQVSLRNKGTANTASSNSNGSITSALSISEQDFEDLILACPASAKRAR